jgi:putative tricarboxylic transport membrane protein
MDLISGADISWAISHIADPMVLLILIGGVTAGVLFGALPGITGVAGIAIMTPLTFTMNFEHAMALLLGAYCGGYFGGSIPAILINVPGTPTNAATALDGYPMARQGDADKAIALAVLCSCIGGLFSALVLSTLAPSLAKVALQFNSAEYFGLAMLGLLCVAGVSGDSLLKGIAAAALGVGLSTIGVDPVGGTMRFTFDISYLIAGIPIIPALIGLFGITEMFTKTLEIESFKISVLPPQNKFRLRDIIPIFLRNKMVTFKGSLIGTFVGVLPGTGTAIATWVSYGEATRSAKPGDIFGKGDPKGIIAAETANNAVTGGAMVPLLTFGIPGDPVTAILIAALLVQGIDPGPFFIAEYGNLFIFILLTLVLGNLFMVTIALSTRKLFRYFVKLRGDTLVPLIAVMSAAGAFSINNSTYEVMLVVILGMVGYFMLKFGYPMAPIVLGIVLGPIVEDNLRNALAVSDMNPMVFITRPISAGLIVVMAIMVGFWVYIKKRTGPNSDPADSS